MIWSSILLSAACSISGIQASPVAGPQPIEASSLEARTDKCEFSGKDGAALAIKSKTSCSTIVLSSIFVPAGTTLDLDGLNDHTHVIFEGTTTFGYKEWSGPLITFSGNDLTITGASGSLLDGEGSRWWDGKGNGGKTKPTFMDIHNMNSSTITGLNIKNSPERVISIYNAYDVTLDHVTIDDKDGDLHGGHNTDGFDVGHSENVLISNGVVYNQDDCLAIVSGKNITFTGGFCSGGHGLSIGSVGNKSFNTVSDVLIENSVVENSATAVRIKTVTGGHGSVSGITWRDITLKDITNVAVVIEQNYSGGGPVGQPTNGVPIKDITLSNVHGTVTSSATRVDIVCAAGACSDFTWDRVDITGGKKSTICEHVPSSASC
ncbi:extracellular polygalacturonase, putative [Acrodontium crateriforme]|uniref:endo-polygalacturonase n=1 Tax=Acrodontium crateriforme TaxID=150365 RepID=A0AAQ3R8C2_9PEZI|nr:extracellular polygalacturonase, putative [Acrodontium crateriforme]